MPFDDGAPVRDLPTPPVPPVGESAGVPAAALSPPRSGGLGGNLTGMLGQGSARAMATLDRADKESADLGTQALRLGSELTELKSKIANPPNTVQTNPVQSFGSAAMTLAALGSLMTRRSMTNALSAGTQVMEAFKSNNIAAGQQAFQTWKAQTDEALTLHRFEQDAYRAAVDKVRTDREGARIDLAVTAAAMKDEVIKHLAESGRVDDAINLIAGRKIMGQRMSDAAGKAGELNYKRTMSMRYQAAVDKGDTAGASAIMDEFRNHEKFMDPPMMRTDAKGDADPARAIRQDISEAYRDKAIANSTGDKDGEADAQRRMDEGRKALESLKGGRGATVDAEKERHNRAMEDLGVRRFGSEDERRQAMTEETERHNRATEGLGERRADQGDQRIDLSRTAESNRTSIARDRLDLSKLSEADRTRLQEGRLDLSKMTAEDRSRIQQGRLDLADWLSKERVRQGDERIDQGDVKIGQTDRALDIRENHDPFKAQREDAYKTLAAARLSGDNRKVEQAQQQLDDIRTAEGKKGASVTASGQRAEIANQDAAEKIRTQNAERAAAGKPPLTPQDERTIKATELDALKSDALTPVQRAGYEKVIDKADTGLDHAQRALELMNNHVAVAGGLGKLGRSAETIGNILGASGTARADFKKEIAMLKQADADSANAGGARPLAAQMKIIDEILETDKWGVSSRAVFSAIQKVEEELYRRHQIAEAHLTKKWTPDMEFKTLQPLTFGAPRSAAPPGRPAPTGFDAFPAVSP